MRVSGEGYQFVQVNESFFLMPRYSRRGYMYKRPILAISCFSSHPLHLERGRRPCIHRGSENSFLNNRECSSLKMATKSIEKAAMKKTEKIRLVKQSR